MKDPLDLGECLGLGWKTFTENAVTMIVGIVVVALLGALSLGVCFGPLLVGYNKVCLRAARGERPAVGDIFDGFQIFVPALLLAIVVGICVSIGVMLLVIPGLIVLWLWFWAMWIMAAGNTDIGSCLTKSKDFAMANTGPSAVFILVVGLISALGNVVPLGGLVTGPIANCVAAHGFLRAFEGEANQG